MASSKDNNPSHQSETNKDNADRIQRPISTTSNTTSFKRRNLNCNNTSNTRHRHGYGHETTREPRVREPHRKTPVTASGRTNDHIPIPHHNNDLKWKNKLAKLEAEMLKLKKSQTLDFETITANHEQTVKRIEQKINEFSEKYDKETGWARNEAHFMRTSTRTLSKTQQVLF